MTYINYVLLHYGRIKKKHQGIGGKGKGIRNETNTDTKLYLYISKMDKKTKNIEKNIMKGIKKN